MNLPKSTRRMSSLKVHWWQDILHNYPRDYIFCVFASKEYMVWLYVLATYTGDKDQPACYYFESTYIRELRRDRWPEPLFQHEIWNAKIRIQELLPIMYSNNSVIILQVASFMHIITFEN